MHVIEVRAVADALPESGRAGLRRPAPSDHGNAIAGRDLDHASREQPKSFVPAVFGRLLEEQLIPEANA